MNRISRCLVVVVCASFALSLHAACVVTLKAPAEVQSGQKYSLTMTDPGPGYTQVLTETWARNQNQSVASGKSSVAVFGQVAPSLNYVHRTTFDMPVDYYLLARNPSNPSDSCWASATVMVKADPEIVRRAQRGVVPLVGKTPGLNGADFRTAFKLFGHDTLRGRLVFHPMGQPASDSDPSIPYEFTETVTVIQFDDLMAAFGRTGLGSLDIIPEGSNLQLPRAETRIFNQTADGGTYGTLEPMMIAAQWMGLEGRVDTGGSFMTGPIPEGMRINIGVLNLEDSSDGAISVGHPDGTRSFAHVGFFNNQGVIMGTPEQLTGVTVRPGDSVSFQMNGGAAIPFYTLTDNRTNDPAIAFGIPDYTSLNVARLSD